MEPWLIWIIAGGILVLLELVLPGGVAIFLGLSAIITGSAIKFEAISGLVPALITWFMVSIVLLMVLRTFFIKHFEGDSSVQEVDEEKDYEGSIVEVVESVEPHREGRVSFRGVTWQARSEEEILKGSKAVILSRDGNIWIIKSL